MTATWTATPQQVERVIAAVLPHASDDKTLPVINCVRLELSAHSFLATATDRYSLGVCRASLADWDDKAKKAKKVVASLRPEDIKRLFAFLRPNRTSPAVWTLTASTLSVAANGGDSLTISTTETGDGYPNWRALFTATASRDVEPGAEMAFTPRVVDHFHKTAKALGHVHMHWHFVTPLKPVVVQVGEEFVGMLMPCRISGDEKALNLTSFGIDATPAAVTA